MTALPTGRVLEIKAWDSGVHSDGGRTSLPAAMWDATLLSSR